MYKVIQYEQHIRLLFDQNSLGECFSDLAHKSPELQQEFLYNAESQRNLTKNGQQLLASLNFFVSSINTIVNKTMEDSLATGSGLDYICKMVNTSTFNFFISEDV